MLFWDRALRERPRLALLICLVFFFVSALGLPKLEINGDSKVFFAQDDINLIQFKNLEGEYSLTQGLGIALHAEDGDVFTEERLAVIRQLTDRAWEMPYVRRVSSITNTPRISSAGDDLVIEDMMPDPGMSPDDLRTRVMDDNLVVGRLISLDQKTTLVTIIAEDIGEVSDRADVVTKALKQLVDELPVEEAGLTPWYGGRLAIIDALSKAGKRDLATRLPGAVLVIGTLLTIFLRSLTYAAVLVVTPLLAAVSTLGIASHLGIEIMALTANLPSIILMLGVAGFSHLVMKIQEEHRTSGDIEEALQKGLEADAAPIALTFATTAIGFLMLNVADSPPINVLGSLVALGGIICLLMGFIGIPALMRLLKPKPTVPRAFLGQLTHWSASFVTSAAGRGAMFAGVTVLVVGSGAFLLKPNDFIPHFFDQSFDLRADLDQLEEELPAYGVVEFNIVGAGPGAVTDPVFVAELEAFEDHLRSLPNVTHVQSIAETFRRLHYHLNTDDLEGRNVLPTGGDALAQYLLLYEMSLPFGQDLNDRISIDKGATRVTAIIRDANTQNLQVMKTEGNAWLDARDQALLSGHATGLAMMYSELTSMNVRSMIGGTAGALVLISLILVGAFRSLSYGIVSLLPNLLPGAVAFGAWGLLVGEVGLASSVVGAITLGIIVDDTIHMIWRYQEGRRIGLPPKQAARRMFETAGNPILVSTIVLTLGFSVLGASGFFITSTLGQLSAIIIMSALICDWFLLAPLLILLDEFLEPKRQLGASPAPQAFGAPATGNVLPRDAEAEHQDQKSVG